MLSSIDNQEANYLLRCRANFLLKEGFRGQDTAIIGEIRGLAHDRQLFVGGTRGR